eukprot:597375-Rhodomonas_salina.1
MVLQIADGQQVRVLGGMDVDLEDVLIFPFAKDNLVQELLRQAERGAGEAGLLGAAAVAEEAG